LIGGFCKSQCNKRRLKRFQAIAEQKKARRKRYGQPDITEVGRNVTPFGIRAIESGIEIEGIWISRSNINSPSGSPMITPSAGNGKRPDNSSSSSLASQIEMPPPLHIKTHAPSTHSSLSINRFSNGLDCAVPAEQLSSSNTFPQKLSSSGEIQTELGRPVIHRHSVTPSAVEGMGRVPGSSTPQPLSK
jgi:hypothetical protein